MKTRSNRKSALTPFWGSFTVDHADWLSEGETSWTFTQDGISVDDPVKGKLVHGHITHVEIWVVGASEDLNGLYMGEVVEFDPYYGTFSVDFI